MKKKGLAYDPAMLGRRIYEERCSAGIKQKDLAATCKISARTLFKLENLRHEKNPEEVATTVQLDTVVRISLALRCSLDFLLGFQIYREYCVKA